MDIIEFGVRGMIAVANDDLNQEFDWVVWTNIAYALGKSDQQDVCSLKKMDFRRIGQSEEFYIVGHGVQGMFESFYAASEKVEESLGIGGLIRRGAYADGKVPPVDGNTVPLSSFAGVHLLSCHGGVNEHKMMVKNRSLASAVVTAFRKLRMTGMYVTAYKGKCIASPVCGSVRVIRDDKEGDPDAIEKTLRDQVKSEVASYLGKKHTNNKDKALGVAAITKKFYEKWIPALEKEGFLYPEGEGIFREIV